MELDWSVLFEVAPIIDKDSQVGFRNVDVEFWVYAVEKRLVRNLDIWGISFFLFIIWELYEPVELFEGNIQCVMIELEMSGLAKWEDHIWVEVVLPFKLPWLCIESEEVNLRMSLIGQDHELVKIILWRIHFVLVTSVWDALVFVLMLFKILE